MDAEFYYHRSRQAVLVNVTDLYDADLRKVLADVGEHFSWDSIQFQAVADEDDGAVTEWAWLHGAEPRGVG